MNKQNLGRIKISYDLIEKSHKDVSKILYELEFIPVKTESYWCSQYLEYVGLSPQFKKIEYGGEIPEYIIQVERDSFGKIQKVVAV